MPVQKRTMLVCDGPKCNQWFGGPFGGEGNIDIEFLKNESIDAGWFRLSTDNGDLFFHTLKCLGSFRRHWKDEYWKYFEQLDMNEQMIQQ